MEYVLSRVGERTRDGGAAVVVFVHGWRHNARSRSAEIDQNVHCFKQLLASLARRPGAALRDDVASEICFENQFGQPRERPLAAETVGAKGLGVLHAQRVIGIYVGWRGLTADAGGAEVLSYWDRKAVAGQVGPGGVTELLLRLEDHVWRPGGAPAWDDSPLAQSRARAPARTCSW